MLEAGPPTECGSIARLPEVDAESEAWPIDELGLRDRRPHDTTLHRDQARAPQRCVPLTEEQLTAMRGGLTAEEYRWKLIREWLDLPCATAKSAK
jgi:hypothetical protein